MFAGKFQPESRSDRSKTIEQLCGTITSNVDIYKPQVQSLLFSSETEMGQIKPWRCWIKSLSTRKFIFPRSVLIAI